MNVFKSMHTQWVVNLIMSNRLSIEKFDSLHMTRFINLVSNAALCVHILIKGREHHSQTAICVCVCLLSLYSGSTEGNDSKELVRTAVRLRRKSSLKVHQLLCDTLPFVTRGSRTKRCLTDNVWRIEF